MKTNPFSTISRLIPFFHRNISLICCIDIYSPSNVRSLVQTSGPSVKTTLYHNASKLSENDNDERSFILPIRRLTNDTLNQQNSVSINETYDRPKSYDNIAVISTSIDRNNNHIRTIVDRNNQNKPT